MSRKLGAFVFVLHTHLPYVRKAGRWPHGEEMVHEAIAETYIPLLNALYDLVEDGYKPKLTIGLTPILLEQLADEDVLRHFEFYLEERMSLAERDIVRFSRPVLEEWREAHDTALARWLNAVLSLMPEEPKEATVEESAEEEETEKSPTDEERAWRFYDALSPEEKRRLPPAPIPVDEAAAVLAQRERDHLLYLARWYRDWFQGLLDSFRNRYGRDIVGAFRRLQDMGVLDVLTSAATHGYLPLLERDSSIWGQLKTGVETTTRHMGRIPRGIWLPECAYRPTFMQPGPDGNLYRKPGIEEFLAAFGIRYFFTDTHVIQGGALVGKAAGDAVGPYGAIPKRIAVEYVDRGRLAKRGTTFRPYYVRDVKVAVFGRDEGTGLQVWSASHGYPGDYLYREFHRKDDRSGLQYWRITGAQVDLGQKALYDPARAFGQVQTHADHFTHLVHDRLADFANRTGEYGIIVSAYDTELFGHWWFEGVEWLKEVLRRLNDHPEVELTTAGEYLDAHPPTESLDIPESSWGNGGGHWTWLNPETEWMWPLIHRAEREMEEIVAMYPDAEGEMAQVLAQIAREQVLLQSSDWPFLVTTGQAKDYAVARFQGHLARFHRLVAIARSGVITDDDREFLRWVSEADNPFPQIDYADFAEREGKPVI